MDDGETDREVLKLLGFVGLEEAIEKCLPTFRVGSKRRVGIARARYA